MANNTRAREADAIINRITDLNNGTLKFMDELKRIADKYSAMSAADKNELETILTNRGFDFPAYQAVMQSWLATRSFAVTTRGLAVLPEPGF